MPLQIAASEEVCQETPLLWKALALGQLVSPEQQIQVRLQTGKNSALAIGFYPAFNYNASGGGGDTIARAVSPSRLNLSFDTSLLHIPSVTWRTARLIGAPLPPIFRIDIQPSKLEGCIHLESGRIELRLVADFFFKAAGVYKAPPMSVDTLLTTEEVKSEHHNRKGSRLDATGHAILVGIGEVSKTGHWPLDSFLRLPTDVLGLMTCTFEMLPHTAPSTKLSTAKAVIS